MKIPYLRGSNLAGYYWFRAFICLLLFLPYSHHGFLPLAGVVIHDGLMKQREDVISSLFV